MDLPPGIFKRSSQEIARGLKRAVESSRRTKGRSKFQSAMSMLNLGGRRGRRRLREALGDFTRLQGETAMADKRNRDRTESGQPGGGAGRRDEPGRTGVWPASGPWPPGEASTVGQGDLGQGARGAAGAEESGGSELVVEQRDPVCGVHVRLEGSRMTEYGGRRYYFDSEDCMRRFEQSPEHYTRQRDERLA